MASPTLFSGHQRPFNKSLNPFRVSQNPNPRFFCKFPIFVSYDPSASSSSSSSSSWEREEARWLREEQRWLREESRWRSERDSLLSQICAFRLQIGALEARLRTSETAVASPSLPVEVMEMVLDGASVRISEVNTEKIAEKQTMRATLRKGSEGEEVQTMQEALLRLGFYSGEADMEFSNFSTETESAVKTWQASLGTSEDGIMTSELLERLMDRSLDEYANQGGDSESKAKKGSTNGAAVASLTEITEIQPTVIKESGDKEFGVSEHRVFLLGENRWEDPARLLSKNKPAAGSKVASATWCLNCRGEGRLVCAECDGSGEPNIEQQFLGWVDEGAKCPYCEGLGYTICDDC